MYIFAFAIKWVDMSNYRSHFNTEICCNFKACIVYIYISSSVFVSGWILIAQVVCMESIRGNYTHFNLWWTKRNLRYRFYMDYIRYITLIISLLLSICGFYGISWATEWLTVHGHLTVGAYYITAARLNVICIRISLCSRISARGGIVSLPFKEFLFLLITMCISLFYLQQSTL